VRLDESPSLSLKTIPTQAPTPVPVRSVNEKGRVTRDSLRFLNAE